jgi:hypothetical protein
MMPATEFYDPILVDEHDVVWPAGPFNISDERRREALAVQFQYVIIQGDTIAWGASSGGKHDRSWFGRAEQEGAFQADQPAQAFGMAVLVSKGEYTGPDGAQYIPVFETICWSKTVRLQWVNAAVDIDTYQKRLASANSRPEATDGSPPQGTS